MMVDLCGCTFTNGTQTSLNVQTGDCHLINVRQASYCNVTVNVPRNHTICLFSNVSA